MSAQNQSLTNADPDSDQKPASVAADANNAAENADAAEDSDTAEASPAEAKTEKSSQELTTDEQREVQQLRQRDTEVRAHEQAHVAAGGRYVTKAASYDYEIGPDKRRYAVGGEVSIDISPVPDDPQATMEKARVIRRAALAPAEPSPQDQRVASEAQRMEAQARAEMLRNNQSEVFGSDEKTADPVGQTGGSEAKDSSDSTAASANSTSPDSASASASIADRSPPAASPVAASPRISTSALDASNRLQQRVAEFFAAPQGASLSQFA
ncbi:putative metalloprotease CJM1_0395 family protein [Rhabdochromatium marinum]|uniref:putative metalloprotease CJM1_0395 family protein n=1 Tax=Rhabdochromatium marinum TaxID=48729 RepID=UPI0019078AD4|nr:putative metalloprotease CJM1_0395 family protein [Rhabdochromatium marinum]MBK1647915.1 hypothetical protein [Rhabdochromatium marinum]